MGHRVMIDGFVFPAQAGVILTVTTSDHEINCIPRASGGDPFVNQK